jgi:hypothetical protein
LTTPADITLTRRKSEPLGRILMEGDLSAISLPDVLSFVSMIRQTGKLVLRRGDLERTIVWREGEIVFATSNSHEHSLGQFLLRNGKITREQYELSNRRVTPVLRHGKVLVMMGAISPKDLWWGVKQQVLDIIYSLFSWKEGTFHFSELAEGASSERITLSINTSSVIMEGIRRVDEATLINERIPDLDAAVRRAAGASEQFEAVELTDSERRVIAAIDGRRTVRELAGLSDLTEFEVKRLLFQLLAARLVDVAHTAPARGTVFLDVEDSPDLMRTITTYNLMFGHLYDVLTENVGPIPARELLESLLQSPDTDALWNGVTFDEYGRFSENLLIANISELPYERRRSVLEEGLNTMLYIEMVEFSRHLDAQRKADLYRFIEEQKAQLE